MDEPPLCLPWVTDSVAATGAECSAWLDEKEELTLIGLGRQGIGGE